MHLTNLLVGALIAGQAVQIYFLSQENKEIRRSSLIAQEYMWLDGHNEGINSTCRDATDINAVPKEFYAFLER